ncbi:imelysin family protein [Flavobacterium ardleyense]|uniref:Imelysin family protein n=1 Tax=Flavobacterium ardleyense TaxID=2038737 RepID=A0ABW5ZAE8_9FLAO
MRKILFLTAILGLFASCSSDSDSPASSGDNYDRVALLTNWADNIIIPRFEDYQSKVVLLNNDVATFTASPSQDNLENLRTSWLNSYKSYQYVNMFNIGKADDINFTDCTNIYPLNTQGVQENIAAGNVNLQLVSQYSKQGFPALDYMLNGLATSDSDILYFYTTDASALNYKEYLVALTTKLKSDADAIVNDWNGSYRATFIASSGNSVSSSLNRMVNNFVKYFEKDIRAGKVGIPAGVYSDGATLPDKVEAYYKNDISKILLEESVKGSQDFFNGKHFNSATEGKSLKSYLDFLNTVRNGQNLSAIINNQFTLINQANANLSASFSSQVSTGNAQMLISFDNLQQNVIYFKLDMMQALNITVDYVDADGD